MREILFRGKRKDNDEWVYGSLQCFKGYSIFDRDWKNFFTVKGDTVGQYIGTTDVKGTKVFEGDIVRETPESPRGCRDKDSTYTFVVVYRNSSFCMIDLEYYRNGKDYYDPIDDNEFGISIEDYYEVIGNIYDNL